MSDFGAVLRDNPEFFSEMEKMALGHAVRKQFQRAALAGAADAPAMSALCKSLEALDAEAHPAMRDYRRRDFAASLAQANGWLDAGIAAGTVNALDAARFEAMLGRIAALGGVGR